MALLYRRWQPLYWIGVAAASINLVVALLQTLMKPGPLTLLNLLISIVLMLVLLRIEQDFAVEHQRILCAPDKGLRTHSALYARGREYARQKMWALAAVHFQRATGSAPGIIAYQLALATAYVHLNRFERARSVLRGAERLEPENAQVRELVDLVRELEAK
jgi:tetratricopeptide (TPR) repeat protein